MGNSRLTRFTAFLAILSALLPLFASVPAHAAEPPAIEHAAGAYLYNFENDMTLLEYEADKRIYPASTVKLMTGILALEELGGDMDQKITVTSAMLNKVVGNNIALKVGEVVTVSDMLHALLVYGANDAAQVLAISVAGSIEDFVARMNDKAQRIGAYNTYYTNPTGMHNDAMVTTVADTAAIARYAYSLPGFIEITSVTKYVMDNTNKSDYRNLWNRNSQISKFFDTRYYDSDSLGMNAGYTVQSGYCIVSVARQENLTYLCVVMNAEETDDAIWSYKNAELLLEWAFASYAYTEVLPASARICELPVSLSSTVDHVTLVPAEAIVRYLPTDINPEADIHLSYTTHGTSLAAPVEAGQVCGTVTVTWGDDILGSTDLIATAAVGRSDFLYLLQQIREFTEGRFFRATMVFVILFSILYILLEARRRERQIRRHRHY
ncbi:MAG: D-alanyl-D-alanine carboxypeptidase [Ruminococcaceae bacterium]|nr:D-alanyl-D-alanine carboxypeptidase [Oscillospiraceae bacterium]